MPILVVREFGCGETSRHRTMHGAVAPQHTRCFITQAKSLTRIRCITNTGNRPRRYGCIRPGWPSVVTAVIVGNVQKTESGEITRDSKVRLCFRLCTAMGGFALSQRQATSKAASTLLSAFRLLPRLEGVYIQRARSRQRQLRFTKSYQLADRPNQCFPAVCDLTPKARKL